MEFWQQNKVLAIVVGVAALALVVLWPRVLGLKPTVVRFHRSEYDGIQFRIRKDEDKFERFFPSGGGFEDVGAAVTKTKQGNGLLLSNLGEMRRWMSFVPRFPFRIPESRVKANERKRYVSLVYTYARVGELFCDEYEIRDRNDGVVFLSSLRNIPLGDAAFGMRDMEFPEAITDPETRITQIALVHELGQLAIRLNVDSIDLIAPSAPYEWEIGDTKVARMYPVIFRVKCDLPTLLAVLHALDGAHGSVAQLVSAEEADDAIKPIAPKPAPRAPAPAPAADPDDADDNEAAEPAAKPAPKPAGGAEPVPAEEAAPGPVGEAAPAPAPAGEGAAPRERADGPEPNPEQPARRRPPREGAPQRIIIQLEGSPSVFVPDPELGALRERFTILRPNDKDPQELTFVANAIVTKVLGDGKVEAIVEPTSDVCFAADGATTTNIVRPGDIASTRFFFVRTMRVRAVEGKMVQDRDGFPTEVTPPHLDVELSVAALQFHKHVITTAPERQRQGKRVTIHRGL